MSLVSKDAETHETNEDEALKVKIDSGTRSVEKMDTVEQSAKQRKKLKTQDDADGEIIESPLEESLPKKEISSELGEDDISTVHAMADRRATESKSIQGLKWNLRVIISNLYMNSEQRMPDVRVPICLHNTSLCMSQHRCAMLPDVPNISYAQDLRNNLYNQHYDTFLDMLEMMVLQSVYPDEGIFDRLLDMIMVLTTKSMTIGELRGIYFNVVRIFYLLVDSFPPCWTALRPYYLHFLGVNNASEEKAQKLKLLLDQLEECLDKCSSSEITQCTDFFEQFVYNDTGDDNGKMSEDEVFMRSVEDFDWRSGKLWVDDFKAMSPAVRLARVFDALDIICWVLERQFMTWLDQNRLQQAEPDIFQDETKPFVLIVFGMTPNTRLTDITRQLLRLYSRAASKALYKSRLSILQRYISLIFEASNTAELQYAGNAVIYPSLGPQTRSLISEFFKIFKTENPTQISTYIKTIPTLKQPYLRFEFANHFMQLFYCSNAPFGPQKICEEFKGKQWTKYKPRSTIDKDDDEQLSREDYLKIMLNALQDYCNWLDLQACWKFIKTKEPVQPLQTFTSSPLATPVGVVTGEVGKIFMLDEMEKESLTWMLRMNSKVILQRPKVNLPVARVSTSKLAELYGGDIRQLRYLRRVLLEVRPFVDVTDWLEYLGQFLGEDEPSTSNLSAKSTSANESDK